MSSKLRFRLIAVPYLGIAAFFIFNIVAIWQFPGYDKCAFLESDNCKAEAYSFKFNFFSELGSLNTNTDDDALSNGVGSSNNKNNTISMVFFNTSLVVVGAVIIIFYQSFSKLFIWREDSPKSIRYSRISKHLSIITGIMFAGVGLAPHDISFTLHVFFANGAFLSLLPLSILHTLTFKESRYINNSYAYGYILFCILLAIYVYIIFLGPEIGPGLKFTKNELIFQVVAQKMIILTFILSMFYQTKGIDQAIQS